MTFSQCGLQANKKSAISLILLTDSMPQSNSHVKCHLNVSAVFLDNEVFRGPRRFASNKILDVQTHFEATETLQYTHFSSCYPCSVKKGFVKGETPRSPLRANAIKEPQRFESNKRDFKFRLLERGYPQELVNKIQAEVEFSSRNDTFKYKPKTSENILLFVTTYNVGVPKLKEILTEEQVFDH